MLAARWGWSTGEEQKSALDATPAARRQPAAPPQSWSATGGSITPIQPAAALVDRPSPKLRSACGS